MTTSTRELALNKPKEILANIQTKTKTLEEIEKKSDLFKKSLEFLKSEGDRRVNEEYPDINEFDWYTKINKIKKMHKFTMRTWEWISEWQEKTTDFHKATPDIISK